MPSRSSASLGVGSDISNPQRMKTEEYFQKEVAPVIQDFVAACLRHRPDDVAQFACHYFGSEAKVDESQTGLNNLSRADYEICFLKPAKAIILEPLVHRLLRSMPANPMRFLRRQFSMFAVIIKEFSKDLTTSLDREELKAFLDSIGLKKNEAELQAIVQQVDANKDGIIDLAEFAIRIPFDISDAVVAAVQKADRTLQLATNIATYFHCEPTDTVKVADMLHMLDDIGLSQSRRLAHLVSYLESSVHDARSEEQIADLVSLLKDRAAQELLDRTLNEVIAVRQMRWQVDIRDQIVQFFNIDRTGRLEKTELVYLLQELRFFSREVNDVIDSLDTAASNDIGGQQVVDLIAFVEAISEQVKRQLLVAISNDKQSHHRP